MSIANGLEAEARKRLDAAQATIEAAKDKAEAVAKKKVKTPFGKVQIVAIVAAAIAAVVVVGCLIAAAA
jgi:CHASE3 domain sensor protein